MSHVYMHPKHFNELSAYAYFINLAERFSQHRVL